MTSCQATLALGRPNFLGDLNGCSEESAVAVLLAPSNLPEELDTFLADINRGGVRRGCNQPGLSGSKKTVGERPSMVLTEPGVLPRDAWEYGRERKGIPMGESGATSVDA